MGAVSTQKRWWGGGCKGWPRCNGTPLGSLPPQGRYDSQLLLPLPPMPPRYLDNICLHPEEEKYRKIKLQNKVFQVRLPPWWLQSLRACAGPAPARVEAARWPAGRQLEVGGRWQPGSQGFVNTGRAYFVHTACRHWRTLTLISISGEDVVGTGEISSANTDLWFLWRNLVLPPWCMYHWQGAWRLLVAVDATWPLPASRVTRRLSPPPLGPFSCPLALQFPPSPGG